MTLREHVEGVCGIYGAINSRTARFFLDVVVQSIDRLTGSNAACVIPVEAVIHRSNLHGGQGIVIPTAQKRQGFRHDAGQLALKGEARGAGGHRSRAAIQSKSRVQGIVVGLVTENQVEVTQVAGGIEQGGVGKGAAQSRIDTLGFDAIQEGLVDFDESKVVDIFKAHWHIAFPPLTGLCDHAHIRADCEVVEVGLALFEGIHGIQRTLHPIHNQLGFRPIRVTRIAGALRFVAHGVEVIAKKQSRAAKGRRRIPADHDGIGEVSARDLPCAPRGHGFGLCGNIQIEIHIVSGAGLGGLRGIQCHFQSVISCLEVTCRKDKLPTQSC